MSQETTTEPLLERGPAYLQRYIRELKIEAELIAPGVPMVTVTDAARAIGADDEQILKSLLFWDRATRHNVLAIASGNGKIDLALLAAASGLHRPRLAPAERVLAVTGYRAGGVPPIGHANPLAVIVDARVAELDVAFGGGGSEEFLMRVRTRDILRLTGATVATIVQPRVSSH